MKKRFSSILASVILLAIFSQNTASVFAFGELQLSDLYLDKVDWSQEITLLSDLNEYLDKKERLEDEGKYDEVKNLVLKKQSMSEDKVLDFFKIPKEKRDQIKKLGQKQNTKIQQENLQTLNALKLKPKKVELKKGLPYKIKDSVPKLKIESLNLSPESSKSISRKTSSLMPIAYAGELLENPLITIEEAFNNGLVPGGLYFLSQAQNADGSFGKSNIYETTANVVELLDQFKKTDNDNYRRALEYLLSTSPKNNLEKAIKVRILFLQNQPYQPMLDELLLEQNRENGGVGLKNYYQHDLVTALELAKTLYICNYSFQDALPPLLSYIINQINEDGGVKYSKDDDPSIYLTNKTAQYLSLFAGFNLQTASGELSIREKVDLLLSFIIENYDSTELAEGLVLLKNLQLNAAHEELQKTLRKDLTGYQYFDGSFGGSIQTTTMALSTLSQPNLVMEQLSATTNLRNQEDAGFDIQVRNDGFKSANKGIVYIFVDDFKIGYHFNLAQSGITIQPGETKLIHIDFPNSNTFIGDTKFEFYLEDEADLNPDDNWISGNFNFESAADGMPALPGFYTAQNWEVSQYDENGIFQGRLPGINVRWLKKDDPNRSNYLLMFREKGTVDWTYIAYDNALNGGNWSEGFVADKTYEVTVGAIYQDEMSYVYYDQITEIQIGADAQYTATLNGFISDSDREVGEVHYGGFAVSGLANSNGQIADLQIPNGSNVLHVEEDQYEPLLNWNVFKPDEIVDNFRIFTRLKPDEEAPVINSFEIKWQEDHILNNQNQAQLMAFASDNIRLRGAEFYYYDPNESDWSYLGNKLADGDAAAFSWHVPEDLTGVGYRVKAIFYDYRGNASEPVEWGPFEIRDGTPPEFGMAVPNGEEVWELGSEQTIKWKVSSVNGVDRVDLKLIYPSGDVVIRNGVPNTGSYTWKIPSDYTFAGDKFKIRVTGQDNGGGGEFFDESDGNFRIVDAGAPPELPWEKPKVVSFEDNHLLQNCTVGESGLDYDSQGIAHMIYLCSKAGFNADGTRVITDNIYHLQKNGKEWSGAELIYEKATLTDAALNGYQPIRRLKYQIDGSNLSHLIWQEESFGCNENLQEIYYMSGANGVWSAKQNVSNNNTYSFMPDFDVAGDGSVHAVWLDGQSYNNCNAVGGRSVFYKKLQNGQWTGMPNIQNDAASDKPEVVIDTTGKPNLVYLAAIAGQIRHHKFENNQWSAATVVEQNLYPYDSDLIAGLQPNELHYTFSDQTEKVVYKHFDGVQWQASERISPIIARHSYSNSRIATDNEGNLAIVFADYDSLLDKIRVIWASKGRNESWKLLPSINSPSQNVDYSTITAASFGKQLTVIWRGYYSRSQQIFSNHADLTNWFVPQPPASPDPEVIDLDPNFENLVIDGAMEMDNMTNWVKWGVPTLYEKSGNQAFKGEQSLHLQVGANGNAGVQQVYVPVEAGKTYKYSFRYKLLSGALESDLCIHKNNSDFENKRIVKNVAGNDWQLVEREFKVPADFGAKRFSVVIRVRSGEAYVDNVIVQPIEISNLVVDGDMELDDMSHWGNWGLPLLYEKTLAQFFGGSRSVHLQVAANGNAGVQQVYVPVVAGATYKYSFRYKLISGTLESDLCIYKNNSDYENKRIIKKTASNDWQLVEREFTVPADLGAKRFSVVIRIRNGEGYIDDVVVKAL